MQKRKKDASGRFGTESECEFKLYQCCRERRKDTVSETLIDIMNALGVSADMIFCDVIDAGVTEKNNQLDAKVSQLSTKDRKTVYDVLDLLVRGLSK